MRRPFPSLPASVPAEVRALVAALTAKNPRHRPQSAREVAEQAAPLHAAGKTTPLDVTSPALPSSGSAAAQPLTLTDITDPAMPRPRARRKRAGAALTLAVALVAAGLGGWQAGLVDANRPHSIIVPSPSTPPSARTVLVNSASLTGRQVLVVLADLRRLGLRPRLAWLPTSARPPGTVLAVQPSGALHPGSIVTVTAAAQLAQQGDQTGGDRGGSDGGGGGNDGAPGGN